MPEFTLGASQYYCYLIEEAVNNKTVIRNSTTEASQYYANLVTQELANKYQIIPKTVMNLLPENLQETHLEQNRIK